MARPKKAPDVVGPDNPPVEEVENKAVKPRKDGRIALEKAGGVKLIDNPATVAKLESQGWKRV